MRLYETLPFNPLSSLGDLPLYDAVDRAWSTAARDGARAYHDLKHLREMVARLGEVDRAVGWSDRAAVFMATLFHDAVYDPLAKDNEHKSARFAVDEIGKEPALAAVSTGRVAELIEATASHGAHHRSEVDDDTSLFLDADMAILAAEPARYEAYVRGVRREYAPVDDALFARGRAKFLQAVLAAESIFLSPYFRGRLEDAARRNVSAELRELES